MSTIKATTLSTQSNATVSIDTVVNGTAKAWVNFNGTGTVAIRASFNVASITDNGVGIYTVNFTTAMPDANYALVCTAIDTNSFNFTDGISDGALSQSISLCQIRSGRYSSGLFDAQVYTVTVFR
jgi:hypothetical protein